MRYARSEPFGKILCDALGLPANQISSMIITVKSGSDIVIDCVMYAGTGDLAVLQNMRYRVIEEPENANVGSQTMLLGG